MKKLFLIAVLIISANIAFAQDKYEFMMITYEVSGASTIAVSIDGKEFLSEKVSLPKGSNSGFNVNPLLSKVSEYQDKGWELMSFSSSVSAYYFHVAYLKKKKS
jgi:hypothetical protein